MMPRVFPLLRTNAREAVRSLRRARLRTGLALVGVAIGIASVITLISLGEIAKARSRAELESLGTDMLTISTSGRGGRGIALSDAVRLADAVPAILAAAPRITAAGPVTHAGKKLSHGALQGVTNSFAGVNHLKVESGRFISDFDQHRYFCVVGAEVARAMRQAGAQRVLGESIVAAGRPFTVVGVLRDTMERYALSFHLDANRSVFIPITTAQRLGDRPGITLIIARTRPDVHYTTATREVRSWFRARAPGLKLEITSARELIEQLESQMRLMTLLLAAIGGISLIVGGIGGDEHHAGVGGRTAPGNRPSPGPGSPAKGHSEPVPGGVRRALRDRRHRRHRGGGRRHLGYLPAHRMGLRPIGHSRGLRHRGLVPGRPLLRPPAGPPRGAG